MQKKRINFNKIKIYILAIFILIFIAIYIITLIKGDGFFNGIKNFVLNHPKLSPIIFTGLFAVGAFFPLPLLTIFGATVFGFWEVFIFSMIGNIVNAAIIFYLARLLGRDFIKQFEEKHKIIKKLDIGFKKNAIRDMILLRFFYPIPVEIANLAGGLSGIKFKDFLIGLIVGMTPVIFASILMVKGELIHNRAMMTIATIIFILLIIIPILYLSGIKKYSKEKIKHHYHGARHHVKNIFGLKR